MKFSSDLDTRRSIRLKNYDYAGNGPYFVTICSHHQKCIFGKIVNGVMLLNGVGRIARKCWNEIPLHYPNVILDEYVIMPNHIHGIITINEFVGTQDFAFLQYV